MNDTKTQILQAAFKLFLQKSFKEVTMSEIVDTTGLSKGAFYHYFDSKEQLFKEVITFYYVNLSGVGFSTFSHRSLRSFLDDYSKAVTSASKIFGMDGTNKNPGINYFLHLFDAYRMLPEFKEQTSFVRKTQLEGWLKIIKLARKSGEIKTSLKDAEVAELFVYAGDGAGLAHMLQNSEKNIGAVMSEIWNCVYKSIKA
jgi:TetR/AcrR family transcriptional regulator, transcriptional repressor for nem operon